MTFRFDYSGTSIVGFIPNIRRHVWLSVCGVGKPGFLRGFTSENAAPPADSTRAAQVSGPCGAELAK
jgi:hypothetical protein